MFSFFVLSWLTTGLEILSDLFKVYEAVAQRKWGINSDWADHTIMAPLTFLRMVWKIKTFFWYSGSGVFPCQGSMTSKVSGVLVAGWELRPLAGVRCWRHLRLLQTHVHRHRHKHRHTDTQTHRHTDKQTHRHTDTDTQTHVPKPYHHSQTPTHTCTGPLRALRETLDLSNRNVLSRFDNFDFMTRPNERKGRLFGVAGGGTLLLQAPMSDLMSLAALMTSLPPRAALIQCQTHFILLTAIQWRAADNIIFINDCRQVRTWW